MYGGNCVRKIGSSNRFWGKLGELPVLNKSEKTQEESLAVSVLFGWDVFSSFKSQSVTNPRLIIVPVAWT